jgi:hypothetical protein
MSALTEAREALEAAKVTHQAAVVAERAARSDAEALRARIADGDAKVKPSDLTSADAKAEHARIVAVGAERPIEALHDAVRTAEVDALCDSITGRLPELGAVVSDSIESLRDALPPLVAAAKAYDRFIEESTGQVGRTARDLSSRVTVGRFSAPTVDRRPLESCRGASHLAAAIIPAMTALGAPSGLIESLQYMASGAPTLPTV